MLDDTNVIKQFDANDALGVAKMQVDQAKFAAEIVNPDHDNRDINSIVVAGMGGSALAALLVKTWLKADLNMPFEIVRTYDLPNYVGANTLVIASSYSGNTEETVSCLEQAVVKNAQIAVIASGGKLAETAKQKQMSHVILPSGIQPRMGVIYNLRALVALLVNFGVVDKSKMSEIEAAHDTIQFECKKWDPSMPTVGNYAKQLAIFAMGKTAIFYGGTTTAPIAYKWKISWNENAKNVSFWNEIPEFNHNEFIGWTSHPIEKPFAVFDLMSKFEHPHIRKRFEVSDRLLSGMKPKAKVIEMVGDNVITEMLWGSILADYVSIYLAILNGINPTPVALIEKLKKELA